MKSVTLTGALPAQEKHNFLSAVTNTPQSEGRVIKTEKFNYVSFKVILEPNTDLVLKTDPEWYNNYE
jgi:hypothetical protein